MKFAIISDVHGNNDALKKVMEDADRYKIDRFIFLGDYIFDLPFSNEVVQCISKTKNAIAVLGNKETYLNYLSKDNQTNWVYNQLGALYQTYRELSAETFAFISTLKECAYIPLEKGGLLYASHYFKNMPQQSQKAFASATFYKKMTAVPFTHEQYLKAFQCLINQKIYRAFFDQIDAKVILTGHTHLQSYGYCGKKLIINPGSCGQPLDFDNRAAYTILEETPTGFHVTERRVKYDMEAAIQATKKSQVYACGTIWCELVFLAMKTGRDYFGVIFDIASEIAALKGETGKLYTNETWRQAYDILVATRL